jgi:NAD-dependent SIR2 family protein deacetylase
MADGNTRHMEECTHAAGTLRNCRKLLVLTGAGISVESGMPTYRGLKGAYTDNSDLPAVMSAEGFKKDRNALWRRIEEMRIQAHASEPNPAHRILAKWEREERFQGFMVATQNIDGLHQKAGSVRLSELHGSLWQMARPREKDFSEDPQFSEDLKLMAYPEMRDEILQRWSEENQRLIWEDWTVPFLMIPPDSDLEVRPNIQLYDESYGSRLLWVEEFIRSAPDTVLVIGCSGGVTLLSRLLKECREANPHCEIININPHEDCIEIPHHYLPLSASVALTAFDSLLS